MNVSLTEVVEAGAHLSHPTQIMTRQSHISDTHQQSTSSEVSSINSVLAPSSRLSSTSTSSIEEEDTSSSPSTPVRQVLSEERGQSVMSSEMMKLHSLMVPSCSRAGQSLPRQHSLSLPGVSSLSPGLGEYMSEETSLIQR